MLKGTWKDTLGSFCYFYFFNTTGRFSGNETRQVLQKNNQKHPDMRRVLEAELRLNAAAVNQQEAL